MPVYLSVGLSVRLLCSSIYLDQNEAVYSYAASAVYTHSTNSKAHTSSSTCCTFKVVVQGHLSYNSEYLEHVNQIKSKIV